VLLSFACLMCISATSADVQSSLNSVLQGNGTTSADVQRALNRVLRWGDESSTGIVAGGKNVSVRDLDAEDVRGETRTDAPVWRYFEVGGRGPESIRVHMPVSKNTGEVEVYRRADQGIYVRMESPVTRDGQYVSFKAAAPGKFVAREVDAYSHPDIETSCFHVPKTSAGPEAKESWRLYRREPQLVDGSTPLILIMGMATDRWQDFTHWAAYSAEAEQFRAQYQLWDYYHPTDGVNVALGFDPACPTYEESEVAYLNRFITGAMSDGVETDGVRYYFPDGPFSILTHSQGGLVARTFMKNYPEQAGRVLGVATVDCPHMGSPFATREWLRRTITRLGFCAPRVLGLIVESTVGELMLAQYLAPNKQSDLDMGWVNFDAASGFGIPYVHFNVLRWDCEAPLLKRPSFLLPLTLSPRDANRTGAHTFPGYDDHTFDPPVPLSTDCGRLDQILPGPQANDLYLDKFFVYGSYAVPEEGIGAQFRRNRHAVSDPVQRAFEIIGQSAAVSLMQTIETPETEDPLGAYRLNDGLVPLQSQLMLDGEEGDLIYETREIDGWRVPTRRLMPRLDLIAEHTFADPARLRIIRGGTHLEGVTGCYNARTGHSKLFSQIAADLLSVVPGAQQEDDNPAQTNSPLLLRF